MEDAIVGLAGLLAGGIATYAACKWFARHPQSANCGMLNDPSRPVPSQVEDLCAMIEAIEKNLEEQASALTDLLAHAGHEAAWRTRLLQLLEENEQVRTRLGEVHWAIGHQIASLDVLMKEARTDALTGLWNRRAFEENMAIQLAISQRYGNPFSIILFDVDHFKQINDVYGHHTGDQVLRQFAKVMADGVRASDLVTRYGGEEFAILLPQTDATGAAAIAERIRQKVEGLDFCVGRHQLRIHISAGVASVTAEDTSESLVSRADRALYHSKSAGRNCIHLHANDEVIEVNLSRKAAVAPAVGDLSVHG